MLEICMVSAFPSRPELRLGGAEQPITFDVPAIAHVMRKVIEVMRKVTEMRKVLRNVNACKY
jgi:hypothetical protein